MTPPTQDKDATVAVAVTGLSCRFPGGCNNLADFWEFICEGRSAWSPIPEDRFHASSFPSNKASGAHFLSGGISAFDAPFFSISAAEARAMDPQQRLTLEVVYEALETAGVPLASLAGSATGVFVGQFTDDYKDIIGRDNADTPAAPGFSVTGLQRTSTSNRVSWLLDLRGPSVTVDTACSSSMVALHLACQALRARECDLAIVAGCNLLLGPDMFMYLSGQGFLAADGRCKSFDASADGYGRGEGFAAVVLRRADDAVVRRDPIRAVIRATGSGQDGNTKGFTLPSAEAQASLIRDVYARAGLDFGETNYIEAHGTGTQAGDLAETSALAATIAANRAPGQGDLLVGSVKSNIGHLEAVAGLAAIIKSVLILENGLIPPTVNIKTLNPKLKLDEWGLEVPRTVTKLQPGPGGIRRISCNSFGYGGSNAHCVLDDAFSYLSQRGNGVVHTSIGTSATSAATNSPGGGMMASPAKYRVFPLSAQDKDGTTRVKEALSTYLETSSSASSPPQDEFLADLAYTLSNHRSHLQWKTFAVASTIPELQHAIHDKVVENPSPCLLSSRRPALGFIFTGQGAQWPAMGLELMAHPVFKASIDAADTYLRTSLGCTWSAAAELARPKATSKVAAALYGQTLCSVLQVALVELLRAWGIVPAAVAGHSSGEIAAAFCAGMLSREDAWKVAYHRGVLSASLREEGGVQGAMMAVGASAETAAKVIAEVTPGEVHVACVNSPQSVTLSGESDAVDRLLSVLQDRGLFARRLKVDTAYHSPHMREVAEEYLEAICDIAPDAQQPRDPANLVDGAGCRMFSSVTGAVIRDPSELGPAYWVRNLVSTVQFAPAVQSMARGGDGSGLALSSGKAVDVLVEVGPHPALKGPATQSLKAVGVADIPYYSVLARGSNALETALGLAGTLFAQAYPVNWGTINHTSPSHDITSTIRLPRVLVDLPAYPWNHTKTYWAETRLASEHRLRASPGPGGLLGAPYPSLVAGEHTWRGHIALADAPWLADHKIQGTMLFPAAGFIAMAVEAARQSHSTNSNNKRIKMFRIRELHLMAAVVVPPESGATVEYTICLRPNRTALRDASGAWTEFTVSTSPDGKGELKRNCTGLLMLEFEPAPSVFPTATTTISSGSGDTPTPATEADAGRHNASMAAYQKALESCTSTVKPESFYRELDAAGLNYGSSFRCLTTIQTSEEGQSCCDVELPRVRGSGDVIIHPATLDAVFHAAFAALRGSQGHVSQAMVPKTIEEIAISANIPSDAGARLSGFSGTTRDGFNEVVSNIVMTAAGGKPVLRVAGFRCSEIGGQVQTSAALGAGSAVRSLCSKLVWQPAVRFLRGLEEEKVAITTTMADRSRTMNPNLNEATHVLCELIQVSPATDEQIELVIKNVTATLASDGHLCLTVPTEKVAQVQSIGRAAGLADWAVFNNLENTDGSEQELNVLIASLKPAANGASKDRNRHVHVETQKEIVILQPTVTSDATAKLTAEFATSLAEDANNTPTIIKWDPSGSETAPAVETIKGKLCISLLELDGGVLPHMSEAGFDGIKSLVFNSNSLLWVTGISADDPGSSMVTGMARVVRNEEPGLPFYTLATPRPSSSDSSPDGGGSSLTPQRLAQLVRRVLQTIRDDDAGGEAEFMIQDSIIHTSRVVEDHGLNTNLHRLAPRNSTGAANEPLAQAGPVKLSVRNAGLLDTLCYEPCDDEANAPLGDDEVEIAVKAASLNFRDVMTVMGQMTGLDLGWDAAGVVLRAGPAADGIKPGDRVVMLHPGALRTVHRARASSCAVLDGPLADLSFAAAASVPLVHGTAWYALVHVARVQKGQTILIHAAAGGVGQAAVQIARHVGLEVFATVGSEPKRALLRDVYGIADDHIFSSRDPGCGFAPGIRRLTRGHGVDVVLNSLAGEALRQTWHCIAPFGTFVEIGARDILGNARLDMRPLLQNASFHFFDVKRIALERPDLLGEIMRGSFNLLRRGVTTPIAPLVTYPASEVEAAFRLMQSGRHQGKIALLFDADGDKGGETEAQMESNQTRAQVVPVLRRHRGLGSGSLNLDPEAYYILAGGLGGLGRSLATLLADNGARKLCFLSRSGVKSAEAQELVSGLERRGVKVLAPACDITDAAAVRAVVDQLASDGGSGVKGVVQCAMVLRDGLFRNMSHRDWAESVSPKVAGTWNLHSAVGDRADFFVTLSSFTAIFGERGVANYAAGGAFQDAVAHFRRARGLRAVTLDVGIVRDVGVLSARGMTEGFRDWEEPYGLREDDLLRLVKVAIAGDMAQELGPQVMTGLATGGSALEAGIETPWYLSSSDARFAIMAKTGTRTAGARGSDGSNATGKDSVQSRLAAADSVATGSAVVLEALVDFVAKMLHTTPAEVDTHRFLHSYGIDSLTAIELINWALRDCKALLTVFDVMAAVPITVTADKIAANSSLLKCK
ncbi:putative polyketide synthase [Diaporthe sp. PMI_573]|nr:putative polyketide synthase [Diaporthaceae sp. PMI_573]